MGTDLFHDVSCIDYPIVDADAHVNEPPDLWQGSVPEKWKERAPKVVHTERGDLWHFDGGKQTWPVGLTATAGQSYFQFAPMGQTYETMRPGSFDTEARLGDMDADGIWAQVLYPSVTLTGARIYSDERELQLACVRAYNEWIEFFCRGLGRAPAAPGHRPHHGHRRRGRRARSRDEGPAQGRGHLVLPERHAHPPSPRTSPSGRAPRRRTSRSPSTSGASCARACRAKAPARRTVAGPDRSPS